MPSSVEPPADRDQMQRLPSGHLAAPTVALPSLATTVPSASAGSTLLLDDAYYAMLHQGMVRFDGLSWVNERVLIPLKMKAWIDLRERKAGGHAIDEKGRAIAYADIVNPGEKFFTGKGL